ncbi:hypothetical protein ACFO5K_19080 [Nocardia halotolerans]|uniref:Tat pathway signal sequence domain protein n=1 Tax=Nocardia halotolerans TaxID=1755878 RepID=A0ABV8VKY3_9NOCA
MAQRGGPRRSGLRHPVVDRTEDLPTPVPHRKVSGHFEGTDKRFAFYFPAGNGFDGRFFQLVYPLNDENVDAAIGPPPAQVIGFAADSGAYAVQTNGGGGYRVDAAAAEFSRVVAAEHYGYTGRIRGYLWGGSGGSFQTIAAMENSDGIWDGAVAYIPGVPTSIPDNFFVRAFARIVLGGKASRIGDAVAPGGDDPYQDLDDTERAVLTEVTRFGIPLRAWEDYEYLLGLNEGNDLFGFVGMVKSMDPAYADDFWSEPGYSGTEQSALGDLLRAARIDHITTVTEVERDTRGTPTGLVLGQVPANPKGIGLDVTLVAQDGVGHTLHGTLAAATSSLRLSEGNPPEVLDAAEPGARIRIDNRWYIAASTYHRHQVPSRPSFHVFDRYRDADGLPKYPQRPLELGPVISRGVGGGGAHTGKITGKMIVVANLLDADAFPWHGDWYAEQVGRALGSSRDDSFRLWYNDNADHIEGARTQRLIDYVGILHQALRDVSAWAERGEPPPLGTRYEVTDGQVRVPGGADARRGVQPVVELTVEGGERAEIGVGEAVTVHAVVQVPPGGGVVVAVEWNSTGSAGFTPDPVFETSGGVVRAQRTFTYDRPGVHFPALRATTQRGGDASTPHARVQNLGRVRVVVD